MLAGMYLFKVNIGKTRTVYKLCSKLTLSTPKNGHLRRCDIYIRTKRIWYERTNVHHTSAKLPTEGHEVPCTKILCFNHSVKKTSGNVILNL